MLRVKVVCRANKTGILYNPIYYWGYMRFGSIKFVYLPLVYYYNMSRSGTYIIFG